MGDEVVGIGLHLMIEAVDDLLGDHPWYFYHGTGIIWSCDRRKCCWFWVGHLMHVEARGELLLLFRTPSVVSSIACKTIDDNIMS